MRKRQRERESQWNESSGRGRATRTCKIHFHARESKEFPVIIIFLRAWYLIWAERLEKEGGRGKGSVSGDQCGLCNTGWSRYVKNSLSGGTVALKPHRNTCGESFNDKNFTLLPFYLPLNRGVAFREFPRDPSSPQLRASRRVFRDPLLSSVDFR